MQWKYKNIEQKNEQQKEINRIEKDQTIKETQQIYPGLSQFNCLYIQQSNTPIEQLLLRRN